MRFEEGQTKERIIMLLKKAGGLTAEDLSKRVGITPMGVRQHLLSLERKGMVNFESRKHGIGRPVFIYRLTDRADEIFPKDYDNFSLDLLQDIESMDGRQKVSELFKARKLRNIKEKLALLNRTKDFNERLKALVASMEAEGYILELNDGAKGEVVLRQYNCPISRIATRYKEACAYELEMLSEVLGRQVERTSSLAQGDACCEFHIPRL